MSIRDQLNENSQQQAEVTGEDALKLLVGEEGKYKSHEELAKGALNAQNHIDTLEQELSTLRDGATRAKGVEDILAQLKGTQQDTDGNPNGSDQTTQQDSVSAADLIAAEFDRRDQATAQHQAEANAARVAQELQTKFGSSAAAVYDKVAQECGLDLDELAAKSPEAVLRLVAGAMTPAQTQSQNTPASTVQSSMTSQGGIVGKKAIDAMFKAGKIKRHEKITLENQQLSALGGSTFWAN